MTRMVFSTPSMTSKVARCSKMFIRADDADDRARFTAAQMDFVAQLLDAIDDSFRLGRVLRPCFMTIIIRAFLPLIAVVVFSVRPGTTIGT